MIIILKSKVRCRYKAADFLFIGCKPGPHRSACAPVSFETHNTGYKMLQTYRLYIWVNERLYVAFSVLDKDITLNYHYLNRGGRDILIFQS